MWFGWSTQESENLAFPFWDLTYDALNPGEGHEAGFTN